MFLRSRGREEKPKICESDKFLVIRRLQAKDIQEVLIVEVESFPTNALVSEYFKEALKSSERSIFVAEDTDAGHVVGYPILVHKWM